MKRSLVLLLLSSTLVLTACSSRLNPVNWFSRAERVEEDVNPLIPQGNRDGSVFEALAQDDTPYQGTLVANLSTLKVERANGGAIIRVQGMAATQGAFDVRMEPENEDHSPVKGVLTYRLLAVQPPGFRQGTQQSRELTAAVFRTDQQLAGVRTIRVIGANQTLQSRR